MDRIRLAQQRGGLDLVLTLGLGPDGGGGRLLGLLWIWPTREAAINRSSGAGELLCSF